MRLDDIAPNIDRTHPTVARWLMECELSVTPVQIRLTAKSAADLALQMKRLDTAFGPLVRFSHTEHHRVGNEFVAFGAFVG